MVKKNQMFAFPQTTARNVGAAGILVLKHSKFILCNENNDEKNCLEMPTTAALHIHTSISITSNVLMLQTIISIKNRFHAPHSFVCTFNRFFGVEFLFCCYFCCKKYD